MPQSLFAENDLTNSNICDTFSDRSAEDFLHQNCIVSSLTNNSQNSNSNREYLESLSEKEPVINAQPPIHTLSNMHNDNSFENNSQIPYNRSMSFSDYNRNKNKNKNKNTNMEKMNGNYAIQNSSNRKNKKQSNAAPGRIRTLSLGNFLSNNNNNNTQSNCSLSVASEVNNNQQHNTQFNNTHHNKNNNKFDYFSTLTQASRGNIFNRRDTMTPFSCLEPPLHNPYQIKIEDDGPHGTDDIRLFTLTQLTNSQHTHVSCCSCQEQLQIFDKFPLVNGTLFLSPICHLPPRRPIYEPSHTHFSYGGFNNVGNFLSPSIISSSFPPSLPHSLLDNVNDADSQPIIEKNSKKFFLNAFCVKCLALQSNLSPASSSKQLRCIFCNRVWCASYFVCGTMYCYDIFAAVPCCKARLLCKQCQLPILSMLPPTNDAEEGEKGCEGSKQNGFCSILSASKYVFNNSNKNSNNNNQRSNNNNNTNNTRNNKNNNIRFFSDFSKKVACPHCKVEDYHFIKPLTQSFVRH